MASQLIESPEENVSGMNHGGSTSVAGGFVKLGEQTWPPEIKYRDSVIICYAQTSNLDNPRIKRQILHLCTES